MPELLGFDDLSNVLADVTAMESQDIEEILTAWGIDPDELRAFLAQGAITGNEEYAGLNIESIILSSMQVGFFLGYKTRLEIETRKTANG